MGGTFLIVAVKLAFKLHRLRLWLLYSTIQTRTLAQPRVGARSCLGGTAVGKTLNAAVNIPVAYTPPMGK